MRRPDNCPFKALVSKSELTGDCPAIRLIFFAGMVTVLPLFLVNFR